MKFSCLKPNCLESILILYVPVYVEHTDIPVFDYFQPTIGRGWYRAKNPTFTDV
jgi:hypothetical protein